MKSVDIELMLSMEERGTQGEAGAKLMAGDCKGLVGQCSILVGIVGIVLWLIPT